MGNYNELHHKEIEMGMTFKINEDGKGFRSVSSEELRTCPKLILSPAHWIPEHKVAECGAKVKSEEELKPKVIKLMDKELICVECGEQFVWSIGEQNFMADLQAQGKIQEVKEPKRCPDCRRKRKPNR